MPDIPVASAKQAARSGFPPEALPAEPGAAPSRATSHSSGELAGLRAQALRALHCADPQAKVDAVRELAHVAWCQGAGDRPATDPEIALEQLDGDPQADRDSSAECAAPSGRASPAPAAAGSEVDDGEREVDAWQAAVEMEEPPGLPGRPVRPELVDPRKVGRRGLGSVEGRAVLLHALAHIEFNAINLALDAIWRFAGMPARFYRDWLRVADEEALHFTLLRRHLQALGYDYGDFTAHDGLWSIAAKTRGDLLARMALVPRLMEARGLDVAPAIRDRLAAAGDGQAARILAIILRDEIGHVAIGNHWYRWLCAQRGLDPVAIWPGLAARHGAPALRGPFNLDARRAAGFGEEELAALHARPVETGMAD